MFWGVPPKRKCRYHRRIGTGGQCFHFKDGRSRYIFPFSPAPTRKVTPKLFSLDRSNAMSYFDHIITCNTHDLSGFCKFWVADHHVGWVRHALAERLAQSEGVISARADGLHLGRHLDGFASRTQAIEALLDRLIAEGLVPAKRGEHYPVLAAWGTPPLLALDRAALSHFGVMAFGIHVNGLVRSPKGELHLWIGRRARDRGVAPGKLDNMIAGGQPIGLTLEENLIKEAYEEAALGPEVVRHAVPTGLITYIMETPAGLKVDGLFTYDLFLDAAVIPRNTDGEVESFELLPWQRVAEIVRTSNNFKFNCNLVVIDCLIRHGLITPDQPDYPALLAGLRRWGWPATMP